MGKQIYHFRGSKLPLIKLTKRQQVLLDQIAKTWKEEGRWLYIQEYAYIRERRGESKYYHSAHALFTQLAKRGWLQQDDLNEEFKLTRSAQINLGLIKENHE